MPLTDQEIEAFVRMKYKEVPEGKFMHIETGMISKQKMMEKDVEEMKFLRDSKPKQIFEDKPNYTC